MFDCVAVNHTVVRLTVIITHTELTLLLECLQQQPPPPPPLRPPRSSSLHEANTRMSLEAFALSLHDKPSYYRLLFDVFHFGRLKVQVQWCMYWRPEMMSCVTAGELLSMFTHDIKSSPDKSNLFLSGQRDRTGKHPALSHCCVRFNGCGVSSKRGKVGLFRETGPEVHSEFSPP